MYDCILKNHLINEIPDCFLTAETDKKFIPL